MKSTFFSKYSVYLVAIFVAASLTVGLNPGFAQAEPGQELDSAAQMEKTDSDIVAGELPAVPSEVYASGTSGTCSWFISAIDEGDYAKGELYIYPTDGVSGTLTGDFGWTTYSFRITSAVVANGVKAGPTTSRMFSDCNYLTSLDLSGLDVSDVEYTAYMFNECTDLATLELPAFSASKVKSAQKMFFGCSSLKSLNLSTFDTSAVKDMSGMFENCSSLKSLDLSSFDTSAVTDMSNMFAGCSALQTLSISGFDTSAVTDMASMFKDCSALASLDVSGFDVSNVGNMASMFCGCSSLVALDVSGFDTANVTDMSGMFKDCSNLASLDVFSFNTAKVTAMASMFENCASLESLDVSGFDVSDVTTFDSTFAGCSSLRALDVSSFDAPNVMYLDLMFYGCSSLEVLDLSSFNTYNVALAYQMLEGCSGLETLKVGDSWKLSVDLPSGGCKWFKDGGDNAVESVVGGVAGTYSRHKFQLRDATCVEECQFCGKTRVAQDAPDANHSYGEWSVVAEPTCTDAGERVHTCSVCGVKKAEAIAALGHSYTKYVSNGDATCTDDGTETAKCNRCDQEDTRVVEGSALGGKHEYAVVPGSKAKIGKAGLTDGIQCNRCGYWELKQETIDPLRPKGVSLSKVTAGKKSFTAKWKKSSSTNCTGYQVRCSLKSDMSSGVKTYTVTKRTTVSKKVSKLKAKKKYYVQIRVYKTVNGKKWYSDWSKTKSVKTK